MWLPHYLRSPALDAGVAASYTTFDPANIGPGFALSNGNLTVTYSTGGSTWRSARTIASKSSGKWYWENTITTISASKRQMFGVTTSALGMGAYLGSNATSWAAYTNGASPSKINNNGISAFGTAYSQGDIVSVYWDADAGTIGIMRNGADQGQMYTGLTTPMYAAISMFDLNDVITVNFGATAFAYTPPSGYGGFTA